MDSNLTQNVPGSTIKCTGKPRIEPINTPTDLLEKLKEDLASNRFSPSAKQNKIGRLLGLCITCGGVPEFFMIYNCGDGVSKLERYCKEDLDKELERQKSNFYNEKY